MKPTVAEKRRPAAICMFVYNNCRTDARVLKEAATLAAAGHRVQVVAVLDKLTEPVEQRGGFTIVRIDRDPPHYRILRTSRRVRRALRLGRARMTRSMRGRTRRAVARPRVASFLAPIGAAVVFAIGLPARVYRYARWRVLQFVPPVRRMYYRRRARGSGLIRHWSYRRRVREYRERRIAAPVGVGVASAGEVGGLDPVRPVAAGSGISVVESLPAPVLAMPPRPGNVVVTAAASPLKLLGALERRVSHLSWRAIMAFHKPLMFMDYYRRAYRLVKSQSFDVYHAHDLNTLPVAAAIARRTKGRLVYDSHELYTEMSTMKRVERFTWRRVEHALIRRPDAVVTVCESIAGELAERYRIPLPLTLLNCPPASMRPASQETNLLRREAGLLDDPRKILLYQGGFVPNRGLAQLVSASRYLENAVVVMMGWGRIEHELREQISVEGLADRVIIVPPVAQEELLSFTTGADVGVIPYEAIGLNNYYTTPNKLFEYIAVGLPIIGSRFPELRRFLEGYDLGRTFDAHDPYDIAYAANAILGDDSVRERMAANARKAALHLVWEEESRKLVGLYDRFEPRELSEVGARTLPEAVHGPSAAV